MVRVKVILTTLIIILIISTINNPTSAKDLDTKVTEVKKEMKKIKLEQFDSYDIAWMDQIVGGLASEGSGEAAYMLFLYYTLGYRYDGYRMHYGKPLTYQQRIITDEDSIFKIGIDCLMRSVELGFENAREYNDLYLQLKSKYSRNDIRDGLVRLLLARNDNPSAQYGCYIVYSEFDQNKALYWLKRASQHNKSVYEADEAYLHFLYENGDDADAKRLLKKMKSRKYDDKTDLTFRRSGFKLGFLDIVDAVYNHNIESAINHANQFYLKTRFNPIDEEFERYYALQGSSWVEFLITEYCTSSLKRLYNIIYELNEDPDGSLLYKRGMEYYDQGNREEANKNFLRSALEGHYEGILQVLDDFEHHNFSRSDFQRLKDKIDTSIMSKDWRLDYLLGKIYYDNEDFQDANEAFKHLNMAVSSCPERIKGECAKYLFKCYEFGTGVEADHDEADKWLEVSRKYGDVEAEAIYEILFPKNEKIFK